MKKIFYISSIIILLFAFFGLFITLNIFHEYIHKIDMKEIIYDGSICIVALKENLTLKKFIESPVAFYSGYQNPNVTDEEFEKMTKITEIRAYFSESIVLIIFLISLTIFLIKLLKKENENPTIESLGR